MTRPRSAIVLSLDFELHWGIRDHSAVDAYRENLLGVRAAIPAMLALFAKRSIACTWATVGMLMARSKAELLAAAPLRKPPYATPSMSPYLDLSDVGENETDDPFHYAPSLVERIVASPRQELATHTFSHYYMLEEGQDASHFEADLAAARTISESFGVTPRSIVFPRNQMRADYLDVLRRQQIVAYRSSPDHWAYRPRRAETAPRRAFRALDTYAPLSGSGTVAWPVPDRGLVDVSASAFLRPYQPRLARFERLRLHRIASAMEHAATRGGLFHLWWHPHNFGKNLAENMSVLGQILDTFDALRRRHGMESLGMAEVADLALVRARPDAENENENARRLAPAAGAAER